MFDARGNRAAPIVFQIAAGSPNGYSDARNWGSSGNVGLTLSEWLHARTKEEPVKTILGPFAWDDRGLPIDRALLMSQWQDGELKFVYPTDEFEGVSPLA